MAYVVIAICFGLAGGIVGKIKGSSFLLWFLISGLVPVFGLTVVNFVLEKNLWPILLLLASPVALLYVVVFALFLSAGKQGSSPRPAGR